MHKRLAREFARIERNYPNPLSEEEIFGYLDQFKYIIPQGSPMAGIGNPYQVMSISNCFVVQSPYDSYGGILKTDQEQAQIMKRRGGVGFDISTIRPRGLPTANAAQTTDGIGVFMERFSNTCREVAQGGRRGALMLTLSVHHPEIRTFIHIKEDLKKVTGANISIRLSDEFMTAVKNKEKVQLRFPVDSREPTISEMVDAEELWTEIIGAAHKSAEPGLLFWDTVMRECPTSSYPEFITISTNPCFSSETLIAVADGRNAVSIKQLAEEGKDVSVYSVDPKTGIVSIKTGRHPRITGYNKKLVRVLLDDGSYFDVTPDHKCLLLDGSAVLAKDLRNDR
jgi:ribonucleoside-diphosphate reductase alpha chain